MSALTGVVINWKAEEFRRVKPAERLVIEKHLGMLENVNGVIHRTVKAMATEDWGAQRELTHQDMPLYALIGYVTHKISKENFFSLIYFWAAGQQHGFTGVRTYTVEKDEAFLLKLMRQPLSNFVPHLKKRFPTVVKLMKQKPIEQRRFFLFPEKASTDGMDRQYALQLNPFTKYIEAGQPVRRVIPSYTLLETYVATRLPGTRVTANPVIGLSSLKDIEKNGLEFSRDIAFHFPYVKLPSESDKRHTPWTDFTGHDIYHWMRVQSIPQNQQTTIVAVGNLCSNLCLERQQAIQSLEWGLNKALWTCVASYDADTSLMKKLRASLIDMDAGVYLHLDHREDSSYNEDIHLIPVDYFWHFVNETAMFTNLPDYLEARFWINVCKLVQSLPQEWQLDNTPEEGFRRIMKYSEFAEKSNKRRVFFPHRVLQVEAIWGMTKAAGKQDEEDSAVAHVARLALQMPHETIKIVDFLVDFSLKAYYEPLTLAFLRLMAKHDFLWKRLVVNVTAHMATKTAAALPQYKKQVLAPLFTLENCLGIFDLSATAKCNLLTQVAMQYIKANLKALQGTKQFKAYQKASSERCAHLLQKVK